MKKSLIGITLLNLGLVAPSFADTLLGVYAGAQGWNMGTSGGFANSPDLTEFDFADKTKGSFYVAF